MSQQYEQEMIVPYKKKKSYIGKSPHINLYDEERFYLRSEKSGKINTPQYHIVGYNGRMWKYYRCRRGKKSIYAKNKDVIHRNINENEAETPRGNSEEVIDEWPDDTSPVVM